MGEEKRNLNFNHGKAVREKGLLKRSDVHESFSRSSDEIRRERTSLLHRGCKASIIKCLPFNCDTSKWYSRLLFKADERFDWNWRIARGLLISTRWILMKKRLETDGESSSWNIVLHLVISLFLTRTCSSPHILLPLSLTPVLFHSSSDDQDGRTNSTFSF